MTARLASSVDPDTGVAHGPCIIVGSTEWTPERTRDMANALLALADATAAASHATTNPAVSDWPAASGVAVAE